MKLTWRSGVALLAIVGLLGVSLPFGAKVAAQTFPFIAAVVSGLNRGYPVPAYLKSTRYSATTTSTLVHGGATVLGCVMIGIAGAAGSRINLYNNYGTPDSTYLLVSIDGAQVGQPFCYGAIFSGVLTVEVTSSGASPDFVITYQGQ